jgi:hypothetical protein
MDDLKKNDPVLYEDYRIVGNQDMTSLRNMIKALSMFGGALNTVDENLRLAAAKRVLRARNKRK